MSTDNRLQPTLNLWDEIFLITKGEKLTTDTALALAQSPRYRILNGTQLKLPLRTLVNLLASAISNEVRENGIISNMSHSDIEANINMRFDRELEDFVMRNAANVPRDTVEYVGSRLSTALAQAKQRWEDFVTKTQKIAPQIAQASAPAGQQKADRRTRPVPEDIQQLMVPVQCHACEETGYKAVRYADDKDKEGYQRRLLYGVSHDVKKPGSTKNAIFHRQETVTEERAIQICKEIHQTKIPSVGSKQYAVTGVSDQPIEMPPPKSSPQSPAAPESATDADVPKEQPAQLSPVS